MLPNNIKYDQAVVDDINRRIAKKNAEDNDYRKVRDQGFGFVILKPGEIPPLERLAMRLEKDTPVGPPLIDVIDQMKAAAAAAAAAANATNLDKK